MKKLFFFVALLCLHFNNAFSQQDDLEDQLEAVMSTLDYSQVPSGILLDKIPPYLNLADYRGTYLSDSTAITKQDFLTAYGMLDRAHTQTSNMIPISKIWDDADILESAGEFYLGVMYYEYDRIKDIALENNLIYFQNDHLYDVPNRTQSPYQADACFVGTSFRQEASDTRLTFNLSTEWFFTNTNETMDVLEIDFDNGSGWQTFNRGDRPVINYPGTGSYKIKIKYTNLGGKDLICQTPLEIVATSGAAAPPANKAPLGNAYPLTPQTLTDVDGVDIHYFPNQLCDDDDITHPLIVVEGFDELDDNNWEDLMGEELNGSGVPKGLLSQVFNTKLGGTSLKAKLHQTNYDIFYVNWHNGGAHIQENAQILKNVIRQINTWKRENGSVQDNIIIGASMGGLVSKWALREMELAGEKHETEFFISFDSPMNGANIPLGLQYLVDDLANYKFFGKKLMDYGNSSNPLKEAYTLVNSDAAKDMLYYHYQASDCTETGDDELSCDANDLDDFHTTFMTQFDALGNLDIPHYAISNGSLNMVNQLFGQGDKLLDFNVKTPRLIFRLHFDIDFWALTNSSRTKIYHGNKRLQMRTGLSIFSPYINIAKKDIDIFVENAEPYDNAPGGMRGFPLDSQTLPLGLGKIKVDYPSFCFIPTISSLDLDNATTPYFDATDELTLTSDGSTTVSAYTGPTTASVQYGISQVNQKHVTMSTKLANFLLYYFIEGYDLDFMLTGDVLDDNTFNLGRTDEHVDYINFGAGESKHTIDFDLTVTDQGRLWINRNAPIGFLTPIGPNGLGQGPININPAHFNAFLHGACDDPVTLILKDGGEIYVGENLYHNNPGIYNTANLYIDNGASLLIKDGGVLKLDEDSKLVVRAGGYLKIEAGGELQTTNPSSIIVEDGGVLEIDAGAKINLWWASSTLHVKGGGELIVNGEFSMGGGDGFFQFDSGNILTLTADFLFSLYGNSKRFIRLNKGAVLNFETHDLILKYGLIEHRKNSKIRIGPGRACDLYAVNFRADAFNNANTVGLEIENPRQVTLFGCDFTNYRMGVHLYDFNPADGLSLELLDFMNCDYGMSIKNGSDFHLHNSTFTAGLSGLVGIDAEDVTNFTVSSSPFNNYRLSTIGAMDLNTVSNALVSGSGFRNNRVGISVEDVRDLTLSACLIAQTTATTSPTPTMGIYAPYDNDSGAYNSSNITLNKNTRIENCNFGVKVDQGGYISTSNSEFGKVKMDCAKLKYNDVGIEGEDVKLEIDAFDHCICTDPSLTKPNSFIKNSGQKFFDICYDQVPVGTISARSNYWSNTPTAGDYILGMCNSGLALGLDFSDAVTDEPSNCSTTDGPPKTDKVRRSTDRESLEKIGLKVFPNPTIGAFEILSTQGAYQLNIYNSVGMKVWEEASFSGNTSIQSDHWPKGLYLIQLIDQVSNQKYLARQIIQ